MEVCILTRKTRVRSVLLCEQCRHTRLGVEASSAYGALSPAELIDAVIRPAMLKEEAAAWIRWHHLCDDLCCLGSVDCCPQPASRARNAIAAFVVCGCRLPFLQLHGEVATCSTADECRCSKSNQDVICARSCGPERGRACWPEELTTSEVDVVEVFRCTQDLQDVCGYTRASMSYSSRKANSVQGDQPSSSTSSTLWLRDPSLHLDCATNKIADRVQLKLQPVSNTDPLGRKIAL